MNILLGVTASISAYKAADLVSQLTHLHHEVHVIMTEEATKLITPLTFRALSGYEVGVDVMAETSQQHIQHIDLAKQCDTFIIAPATANSIAKLAHGMADDLVSTCALAVPAHIPKWLAPAMNTTMYMNPIVQHNLEQLKTYGFKEITPRTSRLACGDEGIGALATVEDIIKAIAS